MLISGRGKAAASTATMSASESQRSRCSLRRAGTGSTPGAYPLISLHQVEGTAPAGLVKEVNDHMRHEADAIADRSALVLGLRGNERPVDEQRPAHDVGAGHKAP